MHLQVVSRKTKEYFLMEGFQKSLNPEINIYNQAQLELERPMIKASRIHKKTNNEIGAIFQINGELKGQVICLVDLYGKEIPSQRYPYFQSLFIESMNIFLGQLLTNLENETDIMTVLSAPKIIGRTDQFQNIKNDQDLRLSLGYRLITNEDSYNCRIYILADKITSREV